MADLGALHTALQYACSQEESELKMGEKQLLSWENQPGYYSGLAAIFSDRSFHANVRWMAITCLKNGIDKYWRAKYSVVTTQYFTISEEEKHIVRSSLLASIVEPIDRISTQLGLVIGRMARTDCPNSWPELLPFLTEGVRSSSAIRQKCCLMCLRDVVKAFSSWRVIEHRRLFYEITSSMFQYVFQLWLTHLSSLTEIVSIEQLDKATTSLSLAVICLKILQLMLLYGFARFNADPEAVKCMEYFHQLTPQVLQLRSQLPVTHLSHELALKVATMLMKSLFKVQCQHPISYIMFVGSTMELINNTVFNQDCRRHLYKDYLVYALQLFKNIFTTPDYIIPQSQGILDVTPPPQVFEVNRLKNEFYTGEKLRSIVQQLVTEFLLLTDEELEEWESDPELFAAPEDSTGKNYLFSKKASVETAIVAVVHNMPREAVPLLLELLRSVQATGSISDSHSLLIKEAVLNALGLTAFDCYGLFDFEDWFKMNMINELAITDTRYKIVRRRLVWLIGNWVPVKFDSSLRPLLYRTLVPIMHPNEDLVVRLTAAESLRQAIDDINFESETFSPFVPDTIQLLLKLLQDVQDSDTKLVIMKVFSQLIEQVGTGVRPHLGSLLEQMPRLWAESGGDNASLLQCVIICTLTHVVNSLGQLSMELHPFMLPIVNYSIDMDKPEHVYLSEDGLELWLAIVSQSTRPSLELMQLFTNMTSLLGLSSLDDSAHSLEGLLDEGSTSFTDCFCIIEAYAVLCANTASDMFLNHCADLTVRACHAYIRTMTKDDDVRSIIAVVDRLMVLYPGQGYRLLEPVLLVLIRCTLNKEEKRMVVFCLYLGLLARSMLCDAQHFVSMIEVVATEMQTKVNILLGLMLDIWSEKLDNIGDVRQRKLFGLAAASLLAVDDICVIGRFGSLLDMCVEVLHDVTDTSTTGGLTDLLVAKGVDAYPDYNKDKPHPSMDTEHAKRVRELHSFDHLWCVSLPDLLARQLETCLTGFGYERYRSLLTSVDIVIREQCHEFLPPGRANVLLCFDS